MYVRRCLLILLLIAGIFVPVQGLRAGGIGEGPGSCYNPTAPYCSGNTLVHMDDNQVCAIVATACPYGCLGAMCMSAPNSSTANSRTYAIPGSYTFTVPAYTSLTVQVWGAGGGGGVVNVGNGGTGATSAFSSVTAYGGQGGIGDFFDFVAQGGGASGGDTNTAGGSSVNPDGTGYAGRGGNGASGGSGGNSSMVKCGYIICGPWAVQDGGFPGGGGGGNNQYISSGSGGGGGGGHASKTYSSGQLTPGQVVSVAVGQGGNPQFASGNGYYWHSGSGSPGQVTITWTDAPSCSTSLSPSTVAYGSGSTLSYTSSNVLASQYFSIDTVGPVTSNVSQSATVYTAGSYNGYIRNVSTGAVVATCSPNAGTLTVTAPATPTAAITSSAGATMQIGESSTITATFTTGSGDSLTSANIDSPLGTGLGADTNPTNPKTITFTPTAAGTYTFYARAQTSYFTSWTTYNSVTVTVYAPCTLNGVTLQSGESATFYTTQTAPSGQLCSAVSQTRTCTNGVLSGSASYQYASCVCAPLYSCSGNDVTYTNASCAVSTVASCTLPSFCSPGSAACLNPEPVFNTGTNTTGHLQAAPALVARGATAHVYWDVSNVQSCAVTENNATIADSWTGLSGAHLTSALSQQTIYTLTCQALSGASPASFTESVTVNVAPVFQEL